MDISAYYAHQSSITDPGAYSSLFADAPTDIAGICRTVQGLVIHYRGACLLGYTLPSERLPEIDTCFVEHMLKRIVELDDRPLTDTRATDKRLAGCCRDFATLFCAIARYHGIPTRPRVGFATYFFTDFTGDHEIVECWDAAQERWRLIDPQLSPQEIDYFHIDFDPLDVPRDRFLVGGSVWQQYRSGQIDPDRFGVAPDVDVNGVPFIGERLVLDLAALNKREMLVWDMWGIMFKDMHDEENAMLLDRVAEVIQEGDAAFAEQRAIYENTPDLRVPATIQRFSPSGFRGEAAMEEPYHS
ncbi:MAG TPA: transglutaminase-like domain-containing protein [Ktedonobacterales bacterium]|nr:transglutaminase-like domain-containing protein [Ktedonobacterales bacterium]